MTKVYHGYLFSWALIYTFGITPAVATPGHLWGFFYLLLLLWQSVLIFNRAHTNRWWTLFLEILVIPHAVLVALRPRSRALGDVWLWLWQRLYPHPDARPRLVSAPTSGAVVFIVSMIGVYAGQIVGAVARGDPHPCARLRRRGLLIAGFALLNRLMPQRTRSAEAFWSCTQQPINKVVASLEGRLDAQCDLYGWR